MNPFPGTPDARHGFAAQQRPVRQMGRWLQMLSILAICGLSLSKLVGCDAGKEPARPVTGTTTTHRVPSDVPQIVAFGNSLTAGFGVSPDHAYPAQLQKLLHEAGYHYAVINAGVSGETTAGGLRRLPWILKNRPSMVILELGANDALRGQPLSVIASNLRTIIEGLRESSAVVVLAGMRIPPNYGLDYATGFASLFERLAEEQSVTLIPFFLEGVATRKELNQSDGIHPNEEGYHIVAETVLATITPLLNQKETRPGVPSKKLHE